MAFLRVGRFFEGEDLSSTGSYYYLAFNGRTQNSTTVVGDFRRFGRPDNVVRFTGTDLSDPVPGQATGTVTALRETLDGEVVFELTGISVPWQTLVNAFASNDGVAAASALLGGDDTIQGSGNSDTLNGYGGRNTILGGGGNADLATINAPRAATLTYRFRDEAVVFRSADRQADLLSSVEFVSFRDDFDQTIYFAPAQPFQYLASYADLAAAFGTDEAAGWRHFAQVGLAEGRAVSFSGLSYIASYADLRATFGTNAEAGAQHYLSAGRAEGRTASFDGLRYIASHGDLIRVLPRTVDAGALHFITDGAREGRTTTFDPLRYIASHRDLIRAYGANETRGVEHWLASGFAEGRTATAFNAGQYLANYADLRAAFGGDTRAATLHFIQSGAAEGRTFSFLA